MDRETWQPSKRALLLGALVGLLVVGIAAVSLLGVPDVETVDNSFGEVNESTTVVETDLVVSNPNPIGISLEDVSATYTVSMNNIPMANGSKSGLALERGNTTVQTDSMLDNDAIGDWWRSHVANDEQTAVDVDLTVGTERLDRTVEHTHSTAIETDILAAFESDESRAIDPDEHPGDDPALYINETSAEWGAVTETETPIDKEFQVYNPNIEPVVLTRLEYDITLNDVHVGSGATTEEHVIAGGTHETVPLRTHIDTTQLDAWWVTHLDPAVHGHQVSLLKIEFTAVIELPSGQTVTVPLEELTYTEWLPTDVFDEGGSVGEPPTADPDDASSDTDDTDSDDRETTDDDSDEEESETDDDAGTGDDSEDDGSDDSDDGLLLG